MKEAASIKQHIADTYRVHQRLIRSRRVDAKGWEFMPRGPIIEGDPDLSHVRLEADPPAELAALIAGIEDWRYAAVEVAGADAHLTLRDKIRKAGGVLQSPSIDFADDDSDSSLMENVLASVSQHARQKNKEQTRNRMRGRMMNGYWSFRADMTP